MPVGKTTKNGKVHYKDTSYNGVIDKDFYKHGTGILTDGKLGPVNAKKIKGDGWVGWSSNFTKLKYIDIIFEFYDVRKFKDVSLTLNVDRQGNHALISRSQIFFQTFKNCFSDTSLQ